jgi:hypothetical protein
MPDEEGNDKLDQDDVPSTSLHAHGSGIEEENERPREDNAEGEVLDDSEQDASEVPNTGGATSGGPGGDATGEEDPSDA